MGYAKKICRYDHGTIESLASAILSSMMENGEYSLRLVEISGRLSDHEIEELIELLSHAHDMAYWDSGYVVFPE